MSSFFEKLKKGMEIEELPEKEVAEEPASAPASAKATTGKEEKPSKKKEKKPKKEKIVVKEEEKKFEIKVKEEPSEAPSVSEERRGAGEEEKKWLQLEGQLTVDVYQTDKDIVIQSAIAGIEPENLDITIEDDVVTIKGNREKPVEKEERNYFYQECYWGPFSREIILPAEVNASHTQASIQKGILTIRIPKIDREKKRKIIVEE